MKLDLRERGRGIKAGAVLRESEQAPAFDVRRELPPEFFDRIKDYILKSIDAVLLQVEPIRRVGNFRTQEEEQRDLAASLLRKMMGSVRVLQEVCGEDVIDLSQHTERLEAALKFNVQDFSHVTPEELRDGYQEEFRRSLIRLAEYIQATEVPTHLPYVSEAGFEYFLLSVPWKDFGTNETWLAAFILRPDKADELSDLVPVAESLFQRRYNHRFESEEEFDLYVKSAEFLLIFPDRREDYPFTPQDEQLARELLQKAIRGNKVSMLRLAKDIAILAAREAQIDQQGKIQLRAKAGGFKGRTELPERPHV